MTLHQTQKDKPTKPERIDPVNGREEIGQDAFEILKLLWNATGGSTRHVSGSDETSG